MKNNHLRIHLFIQLFYLTLRVSCFQEANDAASVFIFNGTSGNDSLCVRPDTTNRMCRTLSVVNTITQTYHSNTRLEIQGNLKLMDVLQVKPDNSNITLIGVPDTSGKTPVIECFGDAGIKVNGSSNFSIMHLSFHKCNVESDPTNPYGYGIAVILTRNIYMHKVNISNSPNTALYFENCMGKILLNHLTVQNNGHGTIDLKGYRCAGLYIAQDNAFGHDIQSYYKIGGTRFIANQAPHLYENSTPKHHLSYGGAVYILLNNASGNTVIIDYCSITGNIALLGAGIYLEFMNVATENKIEILNSNFYNNSARYTGGALTIDYNTTCFENRVHMSYCTFSYNCGEFGGGTAIFSSYGISPSNGSTIEFSNCHWKYNHGVFSTAIDLSPKDLSVDRISFLPRVDIIDSNFTENKIWFSCKYTKHNARGYYSGHYPYPHTSHSNSGVFIVTRYRVHFGGNVEFNHNYYTALMVLYGTIEIRENSTIVFDGNEGNDGGAIQLNGYSQIILNYHQVLIFRNNHVHRKGGAILHRTNDQHNLIRGSSCFLRHNGRASNHPNQALLQTTQVKFENNTAKFIGDSVFAESFIGCYYECLGKKNYEEVFSYENVTSCYGNFSIPHSKNQFVSEGQLFIFETNNKYNYEVIPGRSVQINFNVIDEFNQIVKPLLYITKGYHYHNDVSIKENRTLNTEVTPIGQPGLSSSFTFSVVGVREIYFFFNITLLPCPPGFYLNNKECVCAAETDRRMNNVAYKDIVGCYRNQSQFRIGLWVGYIPANSTDYTHLFFSPCDSVFLNYPLHNNKEIQLLPSDPTKLNEHICGHNRMGVLCGRCVHNTSSFFHSTTFKCGKKDLCKFGLLFYLLAEVVPMVIFFVIAIVFNLSFTSGTAVGFIFFAQFLNKLTVRDIYLQYLQFPYRVFYGLFNLEFFEVPFMSFCLWPNSQVLDVIAMKYVTLSLALALTLILLALLHKNYCSAICLLRSKMNDNTSVLHGLCTFLVICYAQASKTSFLILKYTIPTGYNGIESQHPYSYYGGLKYLQDHHLVYAVPAFLVLVAFTTLLPLVLLCYPLSLQLLSFCNLSEHKCVYYILKFLKIRKLIPFIDSFQSCYKDRYRFFAGLYFVYRILILICYTSNPQGYLFHGYAQLLLMTFLGIHCVIQPYKRRLHNILDALIFFNLSMVNGFALISEYFAVHSLPGKSHPTSIPLISNTLQLALLYTPMIVLLAILFTKTFKLLRNRKQKERQEIEVPPVSDILNYSDDIAQERLIEPSSCGSTADS